MPKCPRDPKLTELFSELGCQVNGLGSRRAQPKLIQLKREHLATVRNLDTVTSHWPLQSGLRNFAYMVISCRRMCPDMFGTDWGLLIFFSLWPIAALADGHFPARKPQTPCPAGDQSVQDHIPSSY